MIDDRSATEKFEDNGAGQDPALGRVLQEWQAPAVPGTLDERVLASYRSVVQSEAWWRRFFTASVRVPLPVALATLALLFVSAGAALRPWGGARSSAFPSAPSASIQPARVEQPVVIRTNLAGFEPVSEVNVSILAERRP